MRRKRHIVKREQQTDYPRREVYVPKNVPQEQPGIKVDWPTSVPVEVPATTPNRGNEYAR